ncbi:MAG: PQQ-binding-like beta-propeller repeat protein [Planctomycetota bacterium]|jgi:hypothetical protein
MRWIAGLALFVAGCGVGGSNSYSAPAVPETYLIATPQELVTDSSRAVFEFDSDSSNVTYRATLDGESLGEVSNPLVLEDLSDGPHMLWVAAYSSRGERDRSGAVFHWTIDTVAPKITVTWPPPQAFTDQGEVIVRGTTEDAGGVQRVLVNGVRAVSADGFKTWYAYLPVTRGTAIWSEVMDVAGRTVTDKSRTIVPVDPPVIPVEDDSARDEFELLIDEDAGEAVVVESTCVTAIDLSNGGRRVVSDETTGTGTPFSDIVVMAEIPGTNDITVFDTKDCRLFTVDLDTGDRKVIWENLGPSDIPATREGLIASDGKVVWVQGPRQGNLVELNLDGTSRRTVAESGWVQDAVALTWDGKRDRLLAIDAKTGNLYEVDPVDGTKNVVSAHDADYPTGFERGLVIDADTAYTIARDRNGILEIDLENGDRSFLAMSGDGLEEPRAIAHHEDEGALVVLDHGRAGLMYIDLSTGACREESYTHAPRAECVGPIYHDPNSGELCLLDGGRCALIGVRPGSGNQRTIADLGNDAPDAVDFHMNPQTGEPVVLERHGVYRYENGCTTCTEVPKDPDNPLGASLALRVEPSGHTALVLDSRPYTIDKGWKRYTIRKDCLIRLDLSTGKHEIVQEEPVAGFSEIASPTGGTFLHDSENKVYFGATECTDIDRCYHGTLRVLDLTTGEATSVYGVSRSTENVIEFIGGTATPPQDFGAVVYDEKRNRFYTLDREDGVIGRIHFDQPHPRYEVFAGDLPWYTTEWTTISHGHGPPIDQAKGLALDAEAGVLYVTTFDRVIAVNLEKGDRVVAAVLR